MSGKRGTAMSASIKNARMPVGETPLERVERDIAWLKGLPNIMISTARPRGIAHLGPWESLPEHTKDLLLGRLDWSGVDAVDWQRITQREVKPYDIFDVFRQGVAEEPDSPTPEAAGRYHRPILPEPRLSP
jgi:hypothetical protein